VPKACRIASEGRALDVQKRRTYNEARPDQPHARLLGFKPMGTE
jgi:hypothetical protein